MLLQLRDRVKGSRIIRTVIISIITIPFALFGIGSYLSGGGAQYAAKVNGEEISVQTYQINYSQQRQNLTQQFGGTIPQSIDSAAVLRERTVDSSIARELLMQYAAEYGFVISNAAIAKSIVSNQLFQTEGQFDKQLYRDFLRANGLTAKRYEQLIKDDLLIQQLQNSFLNTAFKTQQRLQAEHRLANQKRTFSYLEFKTEALEGTEKPSEEAIKAYYDDNSSRFMRPEEVKLEYVELNRDDIAASVEVEESELLALYEEQKDNYITPEQRDASHILLNLEEDDADLEEKTKQLSDIRERVIAGESFAELAKEFSDDTGSARQGGSLGAFSRGAMVPVFEEAVFALQEKGELSDIVQSQFGLHLIQLNEILPGKGETFEVVRDEIEQNYRERESEDTFLELANILNNESYESGDSLESTASALGVEVQTTDFLSALSRDGIFRFSQVREAAFSEDVLGQRINSAVLQVEENHEIVVRVSDFRPAELKPLAEVQEEISAQLTDEANRAILQTAVDKALKALKAGGTLEQVVNDADIAVEVHSPLTTDRKSATIDLSIVSFAFKMPKPKGGAPVYQNLQTANGNQVIVALTGVEEVDAAESSADTPVSNTQANIEAGQSDYLAWVANLKAKASIEVNDQILDSISGVVQQ